MAESYRTDQFYNFKEYEDGSSLTRGTNDNPNFIFPGPTTPNVFTPGISTKFQRGFIRGIYPSALQRADNSMFGEIKTRRLFFQFNPATIDRTVQMNSLTANPLLQDPANMYQGVPGSATFSFELLFNREAEVNSNKYADVNNLLVRAQELTDSLEDYGVNTRPDDVATLGVLADIYILDSIIGQSITPDMVDFLKLYFNYASSSAATDPTAPTTEDGTTTGDGSMAFNESEFTANVSRSYGNGAFLSPLPIRIVFSSLFMVEGFVTGSSVQFVKFSKNYVPTVCKVTLDIQALYFGFAKKHAYLTDSIAEGIDKELKNREADAAAQDNASQYLDKIQIYFTDIRMLGYTSDKSAFMIDDVTEGGTVIHTSTTWDQWFDNTFTLLGQNPYLGFDATITSYIEPDIQQQVRGGGFTWDINLIRLSIYDEYRESALDPNAPAGVVGEITYKNTYYSVLLPYPDNFVDKTSNASAREPFITTKTSPTSSFFYQLYNETPLSASRYFEIEVELKGTVRSSTTNTFTSTRRLSKRFQITPTSTADWDIWINRGVSFIF